MRSPDPGPGPDREQIERRVLRAHLTVRTLPNARPRGYPDQVWPDWALEWEDRLAQAEQGYAAKTWSTRGAPRFTPTRVDLDDCLTALAWCRGFTARERWLIELKAQGLSFATIARIMDDAGEIKRSDEWWRQQYRSLLDQAEARAREPGKRQVNARAKKVFVRLPEIGHKRVRRGGSRVGAGR